MIYRNGIRYNKVVRNGTAYNAVMRNGVKYGGAQAPSPPAEAFEININLSHTGTSETAAGWYAMRINGPSVAADIPTLALSTLDSTSVDRGVKLKVTNTGSLEFYKLQSGEVGISQTFPNSAVYLNDWWSQTEMDLEISGLTPGAKYDLRFLFNTGESGQTVTIGASTVGANTSYPTTDSFDDVNYTSFDEVTADGSGIITVDIGGSGGGWVSLLAIRIRAIADEPSPEGRIFLVNKTGNEGSGSNSMRIDGDATGKPWYPLQDGDEFIIEAGSYSNIQFQNINLSSGKVKVRTNGLVTMTSPFYLSQSNRNLDLNFYNSGGVEYGIEITSTGHAFVFDEQVTGNHKDIRIAGFKVKGIGSGSSIFHHDEPSSGVCAENITIENWDIALPGSANPGRGIWIGGNFWNMSSVYKVRNINPIIRKIKISGNWTCQYPVLSVYSVNALISKVEIQDVNTQVVTNLHARLTMIVGSGIIEKVFAKNHMGNAACIWGAVRTGEPLLCKVINVKAQNSNRYSAVEIQGFSSYNQSGVGSNANYLVAGVTADTLDTERIFAGCAVDVYGTYAGTVNVHNCTSINGHNRAEDGVIISNNSVINNSQGSTITQSGNSVRANRTAAGLDSDLIPQAGSPLIGEGVNIAELVDDYSGYIRSNPPTIGAHEYA